MAEYAPRPTPKKRYPGTEQKIADFQKAMGVAGIDSVLRTLPERIMGKKKKPKKPPKGGGY